MNTNDNEHTLNVYIITAAMSDGTALIEKVFTCDSYDRAYHDIFMPLVYRCFDAEHIKCMLDDEDWPQPHTFYGEESYSEMTLHVTIPEKL